MKMLLIEGASSWDSGVPPIMGRFGPAESLTVRGVNMTSQSGSSAVAAR